MYYWYSVISLVASIAYVANSNLLVRVFTKYRHCDTWVKLILFCNYSTISIFGFWAIFPIWVVYEFYSLMAKLIFRDNAK
jgi:hypothetical protein